MIILVLSKSLFPTYVLGMWYELAVNPCGDIECIVSTGTTQFGEPPHVAICKLHKENHLKTEQFSYWFGKHILVQK